MIHKAFNVVDKRTTAYNVAKYDPTVQLKDLKPLYTNEDQAEYNVTNLNNGFTVLTESQVFPGAVHMGFCIDVGTRDETSETSGSLLALKNTYLKTLKHTNETINYGMIQMSGGNMQMDYDQERTYFKGHCIEYDTIDMFQMMVDLALEPRSVIAANVAMSKNQKSHDLHGYLSKYDPFADNTELLLRTAYGYKTLGMPRLGMASNIGNLDARVLQQFVMDNITPGKCLIVASGVKNHREYVDLVKERLGDQYSLPEHQF
jgi:processing peptidase subunit beta